MKTPDRDSAQPPLRIAHIIQNLNYGGMERVLHSLAQELPARGFEVHVVVLEYYGRFASGLEGVAFLHQLPPMSKLSLFRPVALIQLLRDLAPDIVHSHTGVWLKAARAARLAGVPVTVHTEHGRPDPVPLLDRMIDRRASLLTDTVIAVSQALAEVLRKQVVHDPAIVRVIENGVDVQRIRPSAASSGLRRDLGIPDGALVIGSIGRLEPIKHYALALRAFARLGALREAVPQTFLILAGDGSERQALEALATELGIANRVKFLGWRDDADRLYGGFDLFTLTSRSEGTSISLLEAMSAGVCPVVTDVGGNRAVLGPDLVSLLVPECDEMALADAWSQHLRDPICRLAMGRVARLRVEATFSLRHMVDQHAALYRELALPNTNAGLSGSGKPLREGT